MSERQKQQQDDFNAAREAIINAHRLELQWDGHNALRLRHMLASFDEFIDLLEELIQRADAHGTEYIFPDILRLRPILSDLATRPATTAADQVKRWSELAGLLINQIDEVQTAGDLNPVLVAATDLRETLLSLKANAMGFLGITGTLTTIYNLRDEADQVLASMKLAAGKVAEAQLTKHYKAYASSENSKSFWLRLATIAFVGAGIGVALLSDVKSSEGAADWRIIGLHASIALSLGALAVYTSRLGGQHRRNGEWAKALEVQLSTFDAFVTQLDPASRLTIYEDFARRVLGPSPGTEPQTFALPADLLTQLIAGARRETKRPSDPVPG